MDPTSETFFSKRILGWNWVIGRVIKKKNKKQTNKQTKQKHTNAAEKSKIERMVL